MKYDFTKGNILKQLLTFSLPILFALFLQAAYGAADLIVVGQLGTVADTSGVGTGSQFLFSITSVMSGLSMGSTILIGMKIGQNKKDDVAKVIAQSILIFMSIAFVATFILFVLAKPLCYLLKTPTESFNETLQYLRICFLGFVFIVAYNILGSIFRGFGDSKTPLITVFIACVINIGLDLLLVGVFKMGVSGAAIATVAAQGISVVISIFLIMRNPLFEFKMKKEDFKFDSQYAKNIINLGFPIALEDGLVSISFLVITAIANEIGVNMSAGIAVSGKIFNFILLVPLSFMQSMSAFVAQNVGAEEYGRAKKAMFMGIVTSLIFACILFSIGFFFGNPLAHIFSKDEGAIEQAVLYLKAQSIDVFFTSFLFSLMGYFNGFGKTKFVMLQGTIGAFLVRIPLAYFISKIEGVTLFHIGLATPISTAFQIIICLVYLYIMNKNLQNKDINDLEE